MANYNLKAIPEAMSSVAKRENIRVHVSETNSKLGCIPAFNLLPMVTCSSMACKTCLKDGCYAVKNLFRRGYNVEKNFCFSAWTENTVLAKTSLFTLQVELEKYLLKKQPRFFRIHASGDFFSVGYAKMWFYIAEKFPQVKFLAFTKQWDVIRDLETMGKSFSTLPNFSLVLSGWTGCNIPEDLREKYHCAWCNDGKKQGFPKMHLNAPEIVRLAGCAGIYGN